MKVDPDGITRYITNDGKVFAEYNGDGNLKYNYIYGNGRKLAKVDISETVEYYHNNYLGSVQAITNSSGTTVWSRDYRSGTEIPPKGNTECRDYPFGSDKDASGTGNDYKFTGKEWDEESDLFYSWHRYYDPEIGRFISVDPMWYKSPGLSPYHYCRNNPLVRIDPDGMFDKYTFMYGLGQATLGAIGIGATIAAGSNPVSSPAVAYLALEYPYFMASVSIGITNMAVQAPKDRKPIKLISSVADAINQANDHIQNLKNTQNQEDNENEQNNTQDQNNQSENDTQSKTETNQDNNQGDCRKSKEPLEDVYDCRP